MSLLTSAVGINPEPNPVGHGVGDLRMGVCILACAVPGGSRVASDHGDHSHLNRGDHSHLITPT